MRLWDKGQTVSADVMAFTVGDDPQLDLKLLPWDALASAAHASMLGQIGILSDDEVESLKGKLKEVYQQALEGSFIIPPELEDGHSAIEAYLVEHLGEVGKKIHTGRSRNDQVLVALRLLQRFEVLQLLSLLDGFVLELDKRILADGKTHMPGYTHFRAAMPSSVGMWLHAHLDAGLELVREGLFLFDLLGKNPLGAASGFGVPLKLNRDLTAELLGFSAVQLNPIDVQNSRGRYELKSVRFCVDCGRLLEKFVSDLLLYSTEEFGFFRLPLDLTTGSSIMPQKNNPDVLELIRAKSASLRGVEVELSEIVAKLPSHYHRDFQLTKGPLLRALRETQALLQMATLVVKSFQIDAERLEKTHTPELYTTYEAIRLVSSGTPFRDAYKQAADKLKAGQIDVEDLKGDFSSIQEQLEQAFEMSRMDRMQTSSQMADLLEDMNDLDKTLF